MFDFHLLAIWKLCNKFRYVHFQTFPPKHFPKVMVHFCETRINGVTRPMSFLKNPVPQIIYIGNTQPSLIPQDTIPPKDNDSLSLPRTDFFNSINGWASVVSTSPQPPKMTRSYDRPWNHHLENTTYEHLSLGLSWLLLHETHYPWSYDLEHPQPYRPCGVVENTYVVLFFNNSNHLIC